MQAAPHTEVLTEEKIAEIRELFTLFDKDNDGFVSIENLGTMIRATGANPSDAEVEQIQKEIDPENIGRFDQNIFMSTVAKRPKDIETIDDLIEALTIITGEGERTTTIREERFEYYMSSRGEIIPLDKVKKAIEDWNITYDESLNIEDLAKILMNK